MINGYSLSSNFKSRNISEKKEANEVSESKNDTVSFSHVRVPNKLSRNKVVTAQKTSENKPKKEEESVAYKTDPLSEWPLKGASYLSEIGDAIKPVPIVGDKLRVALWIPSILYYGADIYDKYARGENDDYKKRSKERAVKQTCLQAVSSMILPSIVVIAGQNLTSKLMAYSKEKMDARACLEITSHLRKRVTDGTLEKLKDQGKERFLQEIETNSLNAKSKNKGILKKIFNIFFHTREDDFLACSDSKTDVLKRYASNVFDAAQKMYEDIEDVNLENIKERRSSIKQKYGEKYAKKLGNLLERYSDERNGQKKAVRETLNLFIHKKSGKALNIKLTGGLVALALLAIPIEIFSNKYIMKKFLSPGIEKTSDGLEKINEQLHHSTFARKMFYKKTFLPEKS